MRAFDADGANEVRAAVAEERAGKARKTYASAIEKALSGRSSAEPS